VSTEQIDGGVLVFALGKLPEETRAAEEIGSGCVFLRPEEWGECGAALGSGDAEVRKFIFHIRVHLERVLWVGE
jgi:hypothetical protein